MPVRETQGEKKTQFPALRRRRPSSAAGKSQGDDGGPQEPKINRSGEPSLRSVCFPVLRTPRTRLIRCPAGAPSPVGASPPGSAVGATHALVSHLRAPAAPAAPCTHHPPTRPPPPIPTRDPSPSPETPPPNIPLPPHLLPPSPPSRSLAEFPHVGVGTKGCELRVISPLEETRRKSSAPSAPLLSPLCLCGKKRSLSLLSRLIISGVIFAGVSLSI